MRFGYMIDGPVYNPRFIEASSLKDAVAQLEGKLRVTHMAQQSDPVFIELWLDCGKDRKNMSFNDLERVYKFYPQTSGKLKCSDLLVGNGKLFDRENYKGFMVCSNFDRGIERVDNNGGEVLCEGYYCEVYLTDDVQLAFKLDDFCLAVGYEIEDLSDLSLDIGIKRYLDIADDTLFEIVERQANELDKKLLSIVPESMIKRSECLATMFERVKVAEKVHKASKVVDEVFNKNTNGEEIFGIANIVYMLKESEDFLSQDELLNLTARIYEASYMSVVPLLQAERIDAVRSLLEYGITENKSPEFPVATPEQAKELLLNCDMDVFIDLVDAVAVDNQRFYAPDVGQLSEEQLQSVREAVFSVVNRKQALADLINSATEQIGFAETERSVSVSDKKNEYGKEKDI